MKKVLGICLFACLTSNLASAQVGYWDAKYYNWGDARNQMLPPWDVFNRNPVMGYSVDNINFNWQGGGPGGGVDSDFFAARFTRYYDAACFNFQGIVDDGVRISVDGNLVTNGNEWKVWSERAFDGNICLNSGMHQVVVEYFERDGEAKLVLNVATNGGYNPPPPVVVNPPPPGQVQIRMECLPVWNEEWPYWAKVSSNGNEIRQQVQDKNGKWVDLNANGVWANLGGVANLKVPAGNIVLTIGRGADTLGSETFTAYDGQVLSSYLGRYQVREGGAKATVPGCGW